MDRSLDTLCEFLADVRIEDVPGPVRRRARLVAADCLAVVAAGAGEPEIARLHRRLADRARGRASVIGTGARAAPETAAFLNAIAGTALELDEGNRFCSGHPGMHAFPAAFAFAEAGGATGEVFLLALLLGYEVGARIGIGARLRPAMHPHGTWGTVGAAVAVARLAGADARAMRETVNVASTLALGTSRETMTQGATVRNAFAGVSARHGLLVRDLVVSGFEGERDGLATVFGSVLSDRWAPDALSDGLGARWEIERNYFKRHACCRYNHGALDALETILARGAVEPDDVDGILVETYALAASLDDREPRNPLAARFSVPFSVATRLVHGDSDVGSFSGAAVRDERVRGLARRVEVREDPAFSAMLPARRPARVIVTLRDGTRLEASTETNRGNPEDPYTEAELEAKFVGLARRRWPAATATALHAAALGIDTAPSLDALGSLLECPPTPLEPHANQDGRTEA